MFLLDLFGKEKKTKEFIRSKVLNYTEDDLPENFFITQFMQQVYDKLSDAEKIEAYHEWKETFHKLDACDNLLELAKTADTACQVGFHPGFFTTQEEWDRFTLNQTEEAINQRITTSTIRTLSPYALLKTQIVRMGVFGKIFIQAIEVWETETLISLAEKAYSNVLKFRWKEICLSYPQYSKYRDMFFSYANSEEAIEAWDYFYAQSILKTREDFGAYKWADKFLSVTKRIEDEHPNIFKAVVGTVSQYSSFREIQDFSSNEIDRIIDLYKNGTMSGIYKKEKDPKYKKES